MRVSKIFRKFMEEAPVPIRVRALIERVFNPETLDKWFEETAEDQYTKDLLFSSVFEIMSLVVSKIQPSVNCAYQSLNEEISVSIKSVYNTIRVLCYTCDL